MLVGMAGSMMLAGGRASFIGATAIMTTSTNITWPVGTQNGDFCILVGVDNTAWSVDWTVVKAWTNDIDASPAGHAVYSRVVTAGDISSPPRMPTSGGMINGQWQALVYRGVSSATIVQTISAGDVSSVDMSTVVVGGGVKKLLAIGIERDSATAPSHVSGWSGRAAGVGTYWGQAISDIDVNLYAGGTITIPLIQSYYNGLGEIIALS